MKLGFVGLGKMGMHMVSRLIGRKHTVVVHNRSADKVREAVRKGAKGASSLEELAKMLGKQKYIWLMVPAGDPVDEMITGLLPYLSKGDIIIDGGNSHYQDSVRRAEFLKTKGIYYLDVGTSGGLGGAENGYCLMVGGDKIAYEKLEPAFESLSAKQGYGYMGKSGAGHYVKMIHNGIEYALLQSYGEGFELLKESPYRLELDKISEIWKNGSVIRSWLLDLMAEALRQDPSLKNIKDFVGGGSTGRWAVQESFDLEVPAPMMSLALALRYRSRQKESFASKSVAALRKGFGGHETK